MPGRLGLVTGSSFHGLAGRQRLSEPPTPVAIGLGSNLGDRVSNLELGWTALGSMLQDARVSNVYETEPLHVERQPDFLNACVVGVSKLSPRELLAHCRRVERRAGRTGRGCRFGPRTLDVDVLLYGDRVVRSRRLTVPHPRMLERAFVLIPLSEIAGEWVVPGVGRTVGELAGKIDASPISLTEWSLDDPEE